MFWCPRSRPSIPALTKNVHNNTRSAHDINERQRMLLSKIRAEASSLSPAAQQALKEAEEVASGLDPYLDQISSSPPEILDEMIRKTYETDWKKLYTEGTTSIPLIKEMCAGGYEAVLLREFATMIKVCMLLSMLLLEAEVLTGFIIFLSCSGQAHTRNRSIHINYNSSSGIIALRLQNSSTRHRAVPRRIRKALLR